LHPVHPPIALTVLQTFDFAHIARVLLVASIVAILPFAESASAADIEPGSGNWAPSVGIVGGADVQDVKASSTTTAVQPPVISPVPGNLRPDSDGDVRIYAATVGVDFGLMSPRIADQAGLPRFFIHANIEANLSADAQPTSESARGSLRGPLGSTGAPVATFAERSVLGQGTQGLVSFDPLQVRAGFGMAFSFEALGRRVRIKPSFEYIRKRVESRAGLSRVIQTGGVPGQGNQTFIEADNLLTQARFAVLDIDFTSTLHGIGPGLEVEVDAWRSGPNIISLFGSFSAYRFLGDLSETGSASTNNPGIPETATFRFDYDPWAYRVGFGFRFRWQPE